MVPASHVSTVLSVPLEFVLLPMSLYSPEDGLTKTCREMTDFFLGVLVLETGEGVNNPSATIWKYRQIHLPEFLERCVSNVVTHDSTNQVPCKPHGWLCFMIRRRAFKLIIIPTLFNLSKSMVFTWVFREGGSYQKYRGSGRVNTRTIG